MKFMQWILKLTKSKTTWFVLALYIIINLWFYWGTFWSQMLYDRSQDGWEVTGEIRASEWGIEQVLHKIDRGENPYSRIDNIVYPFGVDIVASDPGLAFLVAPWRKLMSIHQALILVVVTGMIGAGLGMYLLLRELGLTRLTSFVIGLAYENNTFLLPRMGHVGYLASFWIFPWFLWLWMKFRHAKRSIHKILFSVALSTLFLLSLWINFYYFVILSLAILIGSCYYLIKFPLVVWKLIKENVWYELIAINTIILLSWKWVETLWTTLKFSEVAKPQGWGGAIEFSSDLINVIVPSPYNYYYGWLISKLAKHVVLIQGIFEDYNYAGLLILLCLTYVVYNWIRKKTWVADTPIYLMLTITFWILTLGPFLQIAGRMFITLEEDIRVVLPLPFALLHYLPYLNNMRVPGRLAMGMIFFGLVVSAIVIDRIRSQLTSHKRKWLYVLIVIIILVDQRPVNMQLEEIVPDYPRQIYATIREDSDHFSVLLIPFTVRDGFTWFGELNAVNMDYIQTYLNKPLIGGYVGRIPDYVKEYYRSNPFIGELGRVIDPQLQTNPFMLNVRERDPWLTNTTSASSAIDLLQIKYVVVEDKYSDRVDNYLSSLGYKVVKVEGSTKLYMIDLIPAEHLNISVGNQNDQIQLGMGWWSRENGYRWAQKKTSVMMRTTEGGVYRLQVEGESFYRPRNLFLYIDEVKISSYLLGISPQKVVSQEFNLTPGLHQVHLLFDSEDKPSEVIPGSMDPRNLAAKISNISLERMDK